MSREGEMRRMLSQSGEFEQPREARRDEEMDSPLKPLENAQPCQCLDLGPGLLIPNLLIPCFQNHERIHCFKPLSLW